MTPRPKNPRPDRRKEILDAALELFARKGYSAATNAEIARAAGVTAAALYYYFPSKLDLFKAAVFEQGARIGPILQAAIDQLLELPPDLVLPMLFRQVFSVMREERPQRIIRIIITEAPRNPELRKVWQDDVVGTIAPFLLTYLNHQKELGRIQPVDPRVVVTILLGPLIFLILARDMMQVDVLQGLTDESFIEQYPGLVLHGVSRPITSSDKE